MCAAAGKFFLELCIRSVKQVGTDCVEITSLDGSAFFVRLSYLRAVSPAAVCDGAAFADEQADDIIRAGQAFVVEKKCESLLARCEQCRAGLERKMRQKGFDKEPVAYALDYLERRQFLDDGRFAAAWLRSHAVSKCQGRARLAGELAARGISRDIAAAALDAFFAEYDEAALCRKAVAKATRAGRSGDKLVKYLLDSGFSYRLIRAQLERGEP